MSQGEEASAESEAEPADAPNDASQHAASSDVENYGPSGSSATRYGHPGYNHAHDAEAARLGAEDGAADSSTLQRSQFSSSMPLPGPSAPDSSDATQVVLSRKRQRASCSMLANDVRAACRTLHAALCNTRVGRAAARVLQRITCSGTRGIYLATRSRAHRSNPCAGRLVQDHRRMPPATCASLLRTTWHVVCCARRAVAIRPAHCESTRHSTFGERSAPRCNAVQHAATQYNMLQRSTPRCRASKRWCGRSLRVSCGGSIPLQWTKVTRVHTHTQSPHLHTCTPTALSPRLVPRAPLLALARTHALAQAPCRAGCRAACDTVPCGMPCRVG